MAEVKGKTSIKIDELVNGTVVSGSVDSSGHLILTTRGGTSIDAGYIGSQFGATWVNGQAYNTNDVVGYAGMVWKALGPSTGKPPALFTSLWRRMSGDSRDWVERDSYFTGDTLSESWDLTTKTGTSTPSYSTIPGEFETGTQSLKLSMNPTSSQRILPKEENILHGGEHIAITVRAKLVSAVAGVTINAELLQNNTTGPPSPAAAGLTTSASIEGAKTLTTSWQNFTFNITAVNAKPRATASVFVNTSAGAAAVVIDRIQVRRFEDTETIPGSLAVGSVLSVAGDTQLQHLWTNGPVGRFTQPVQTLPGNAWTQMALIVDGDTSQPNNLILNANAINIGVSGWYMVTAMASFTEATGRKIFMGQQVGYQNQPFESGTRIFSSEQASYGGAGYFSMLPGAGLVYLQAGQWLNFWCYSSSPTAVNGEGLGYRLGYVHAIKVA